jgi:hypothetical protein
MERRRKRKMPDVYVYYKTECTDREFRVSVSVSLTPEGTYMFCSPKDNFKIEDIVLKSDSLTPPTLEEQAEIEATIDLEMVEEGDWQDEPDELD